eukprot:1798834-Pyramimonas_sp.AAC.1
MRIIYSFSTRRRSGPACEPSSSRNSPRGGWARPRSRSSNDLPFPSPVSWAPAPRKLEAGCQGGGPS